MADTMAAIRDFVMEEFVPDDDIDIDETTNLLEEEVVDSLGIFTLVAFIESKFSVSVDAAEVNLQNFETLTSITKLVDSKLAG
jgi:acyl carrier protein